MIYVGNRLSDFKILNADGPKKCESRKYSNWKHVFRFWILKCQGSCSNQGSMKTETICVENMFLGFEQWNVMDQTIVKTYMNCIKKMLQYFENMMRRPNKCENKNDLTLKTCCQILFKMGVDEGVTHNCAPPPILPNSRILQNFRTSRILILFLCFKTFDQWKNVGEC